MWNDGHRPSERQIKEFTNTPLWDDLANHLQRTYNIQPNFFYSCCSMQNGYFKGWNVKYAKGGKALCTLYPKQGYFVALIAVSAKEIAEADLLIPLCDEYTQSLYRQTEFGAAGKSLPIEVTSENILCDVKNLIELRTANISRGLSSSIKAVKE